MWLLKLHIAISIFCWLGMRCMFTLFKERYERYKVSHKYKSKFAVRMCVYICPIVNVICVIAVLYMAFASDEFVEEVNSHNEEV